jgi:hypothetical protein
MPSGQAWAMALLGTILLIVLILFLLGSIPAWPHSRGWGYGPSGFLGFLLLVLIILLVIGIV